MFVSSQFWGHWTPIGLFWTNSDKQMHGSTQLSMFNDKTYVFNYLNGAEIKQNQRFCYVIYLLPSSFLVPHLTDLKLYSSYFSCPPPCSNSLENITHIGQIKYFEMIPNYNCVQLYTEIVKRVICQTLMP